MILIFLNCLIIFTITKITSFWDMNSVSSNTLHCLKQSGYLSQIFITSFLNGQNESWTLPIQPHSLKNLETKVNLVLDTQFLNGSRLPRMEAMKFIKQVPLTDVQTLWVSVSSYHQSFKPTCSYLYTFVRYLQLLSGKKIGIQTQPLFWNNIFKESCTLLKQFPLFLSFNNFVPFGGWKKYQYFETYQYVPVCGNPGMQVFRN